MKVVIFAVFGKDVVGLQEEENMLGVMHGSTNNIDTVRIHP